MAAPERDPAAGRFMSKRDLFVVPPPEPEPLHFGNWPADAQELDVVRVPRMAWWRRMLYRLGLGRYSPTE